MARSFALFLCVVTLVVGFAVGSLVHPSEGTARSDDEIAQLSRRVARLESLTFRIRMNVRNWCDWYKHQPPKLGAADPALMNWLDNFRYCDVLGR